MSASNMEHQNLWVVNQNDTNFSLYISIVFKADFLFSPFFPQLHCFAIQMIGLHMQKQSSEVFYKKKLFFKIL